MLAVVYASVPTSAAVYYTGSVQTMDVNGDAKTVFFVNPGIQGDSIYVSVELMYQGELYNGSIMAVLYDQYGDDRSWLYADTGVTEWGVYESWVDPPVTNLNVPQYITDGQLMVVCDVVVFVDDIDYGWVEFARTQVIVKQEGLYLEPSSGTYYPGEEVTVTVITRETQDFYIEVVNGTGDAIEEFLNIETSEGYYSTVWTVNDAPDDYYYMYVRAEIDDDIWMGRSFWIQMYEFLAYTDRDMVLLGETVDIAYEVVELATESVYADVTIEWNAMWDNESGNETMDSGTLPESSGVFEFTIPTENIAAWSYIDLTMWANGTDSDRSVQWWTNFAIGGLAGDVETYYEYYYPGDTVEVSTDAWVEDLWSWDYLPDADVEVVVTYNGSEIAEYGKAGTTDSYGSLTYDFDLVVGADRGSYLVTATISKVDYEVVVMTSFQVYWTGSLDMVLDKDTYLSGEIAQISFTAIWNDEEFNATPVHYTVWDATSWTIIGSGDAATGTDAMFEIPDDFTGSFEVYAEANLDGMFFNDWEWADVVFAEMLLSPAADVYSPGDTITWLFEVMTVSANGTLSYTIEDDEDVQVDSGSIVLASSGTIDFDVPSLGSSSHYTATLTFDAGGNWVIDRDSTIWRESDFDLSVWLNTNSKFVSGAFEPGTELNFGFEIVAYEEEEARLYEVMFFIDGAAADYTVFASLGEGEFLYQIPDDAVDGWYEVDVYLYDAVEGWYLNTNDYAWFEVEADQSAWDRSVGGMSLVDFTILILIVLMIVVMILVPFLKGRLGAPKAAETPTPPPPEQGKSPPPA
jgi:hypothetical protein